MRAILLIGSAEALNIGEQPLLYAKLHGASNYCSNDLTEKRRVVRDLYVVGELQVARDFKCLNHGLMTPCLEQHHRNWVVRNCVSDDQLRDDVEPSFQVRNGLDYTNRNSKHKG